MRKPLRQPSLTVSSPERIVVSGPSSFAASACGVVEGLDVTSGGNRLPPLVTSSPSTTPQADAAKLDGPDTTILSGDETVNDGWRSGFRISAGVWLDCCHCCSIGGDYFNIGNDDY